MSYLDDKLIEAVKIGNLAEVERLLKSRADVHAYGDKALNWASYNGHIGIVELLLKSGANIHAHDDWSLRLACEHGHIGVAVKLVEVGADLKVLGKYWFMLFNCEAPDDLVDMGVEEVVKLLEVEAIRRELV